MLITRRSLLVPAAASLLVPRRGIAAPLLTTLGVGGGASGGGGGGSTFKWASYQSSAYFTPATTLNVGSTQVGVANGTFASGDLLLAFVGVNNNTTADPGAIAMSGWTGIVNYYLTGSANRGAVFYKIAGASESGSYPATWTSTGTGMWALANYGSATIDGSAYSVTGLNGTSASMVVPSVTVSGSADILVSWFMFQSSSATLPTGFTQRVATVITSNTMGMLLGDETLTASGATGTRTGSDPNYDAWVGGLIGLLP